VRTDGGSRGGRCTGVVTRGTKWPGTRKCICGAYNTGPGRRHCEHPNVLHRESPGSARASVRTHRTGTAYHSNAQQMEVERDVINLQYYYVCGARDTPASHVASNVSTTSVYPWHGEHCACEYLRRTFAQYRLACLSPVNNIP